MDTGTTPPPAVIENWWSWEKEPPAELLKAGLVPMIRPRMRPQEDDPVLTAQHAMAHANEQLEDLRDLRYDAGFKSEPPIGILLQDLGGYHKRKEEFRTLFDHTMPMDRVIENIQWWRETYRHFLGMWHSQEVWNEDFVPRPRIHTMHLDWEHAWIFGEDSPERDWRVAMVTEPALLLKYRPVMTNWTCLNFLNTVNCVCYSPKDAKIEKSIATVRHLAPIKSVWITSATRTNRRGETFTPEIQAELIKTLRGENFRIFIYWNTESSDTDWKALLNSMEG